MTAPDLPCQTAQALGRRVSGADLWRQLPAAPAQLDETILFDDRTYVLDIRSPGERRKSKSLPNSHEINPFKLKKYLHQLPRDKHIIVVCPGGGHSFIIAYYLKSQGFQNVSDVRGGLESWKILRSDLYRKFAGQNIMAL